MSEIPSNTYIQEVTSEDIPLLSADPELKARWITNSSLFEFQAMMNGNPKPETVRKFTAMLRFFLSNYSSVQEDGTTQVLVDGAMKKLSGIMFNDHAEHEFLLTANVASQEEKDLIPQGVDRTVLQKFQVATVDHTVDYLFIMKILDFFPFIFLGFWKRLFRSIIVCSHRQILLIRF